MLPETGEFRKAKFNGAVSAPKPTPGEVHVFAAPIAPIHRILGGALGRSTGFAL